MLMISLLLLLNQAEVDPLAVRAANEKAFKQALAVLVKKRALEVIDAQFPAREAKPGFRLVKLRASHAPMPDDPLAIDGAVVRDPKSKKLRLVLPEARVKKTLTRVVKDCPQALPPGAIPMKEVNASLPEALAGLSWDSDLFAQFDATDIEKKYPADCR